MMRLKRFWCNVVIWAVLLTAAVPGMAADNPEPVNVALNKSASQSTTDFGGTSDKAVDGNTSGSFGNGSITHTGQDLYAWWEVDLGAIYAIDMIRVWNRTDCCSNRLDDAYLFVSESPFASNDPLVTAADEDVHTFRIDGEAPNTAPAAAEFSVLALGRYVRVQLPGTGYLSLAEVEVFQWHGALQRTIVYSTTEPTNQSVTATLTPAEGVTVTNNGGSPVHIFEENGSFTFEFIDEDGNEQTVTAAVYHIDSIAPVTADDAPADGAAGAVAVTLTASDEGSGVASTYYRINDGEPQSGTTVHVAETGTHSLTYWSVDEVGNVEEPKQVWLAVYSRATATSLAVGETYSIAGDTVALSASVAGNAPWEPQGMVSFWENGEPLGSASVDDGAAVLEISALPTGAHSITASYEGDDRFDGSVSGAVLLTVAEPVLDSLTLDHEALPFDPGVTWYAVVVAPESDVLAVAPVAPVADMKLVINGNALDSGEESREVPLQPGGNVITVGVADARGEIRNTYTIMAMRPLHQLWDIGDAFRAAQAQWDVDNDGHFAGQDMAQLLHMIEPRLAEEP